MDSDIISELLKKIEELGQLNNNLSAQLSKGVHAMPEDIFRRCFCVSPTPSLLVDTDREIILDANQAAVNIYGFQINTLLQTSLSKLEPTINLYSLKECVEGDSRRVRHILSGGRAAEVDIVTTRPIPSDRALQLWTVYEIKKESERFQLLKKSEQRFREMIDLAQDMIYRTDVRGFYTYGNPFLLSQIDYSLEEFCRMHYTDLIRADFRYPIQAAYTAQGVNGTGNSYHEIPVITKHGSEIWIGQNVQPIKKHGQVIGFQAIARVITAKRTTEMQIAKHITYLHRKLERLRARTLHLTSAKSEMEDMALTDYLTGLNNRRAFQKEIAEEFEKARNSNSALSLLVIDLDHFKRVNDTTGHPAGDELLHEVGTNLAAKLRQTDIVARFGGDEFAVILPGTDQFGATTQAERLREMIEEIFEEERVTASIGASSLREETTNIMQLIVEADTALLSAKNQGRNRVRHYSNIESIDRLNAVVDDSLFPPV